MADEIMKAPTKKVVRKTFKKTPDRIDPLSEHIGRGRYSKKDSPLMNLLRRCTSAEKDILAMEVGTSIEYLYQLAGGHRSGMSLKMAFKIEDAAVMLSAGNPEVPALTAREMHEYIVARDEAVEA
jgi:hypothetical protein